LQEFVSFTSEKEGTPWYLIHIHASLLQ